MKIALSANRPNLDGEMDPRFGRCQYFIFVEPETMQYEIEENTNLSAASGAGISTAQFIASKGAKALITGNIGPNAYKVLAGAGIKMFTGVGGRIRDVIEAYKSGDLKSSAGPTGGMGMGMGRGRGQGGGMGRRRGAGLGINQSEDSWREGNRFQTSGQEQQLGDEISHLKIQAETLAEELVRIQERIKQIEDQR